MSLSEFAAIPGVPQESEARVFEEPWQAEIFAIVVALHAAGLFAWTEWAEALSAELTHSRESADGSGYYVAWTRALERVLAAKGVAGTEEIETMTAAWHRAAEATPHGQPILLGNDPHRECRRSSFNRDDDRNP